MIAPETVLSKIACLLLAATVKSASASKDRRAWKEGFDINTDYDRFWPNTGVLREVRYSLYIISLGHILGDELIALTTVYGL